MSVYTLVVRGLLIMESSYQLIKYLLSWAAYFWLFLLQGMTSDRFYNWEFAVLSHALEHKKKRAHFHIIIFTQLCVFFPFLSLWFLNILLLILLLKHCDMQCEWFCDDTNKDWLYWLHERCII